MKSKNFSIRKRINSFRFAISGLKILIQEEHNARIHLVAALVVIAAGFLFNISTAEWLAIVFAIALVFITELINTAIENIADFVSPGKQEQIRKIKDLSAAAVLVSALIAAVVGILVFLF